MFCWCCWSVGGVFCGLCIWLLVVLLLVKVVFFVGVLLCCVCLLYVCIDCLC